MSFSITRKTRVSQVMDMVGLAIDLAGGDIGAGFYVMSILFTFGAAGIAYLALRSTNIRESFTEK